MYHVDREEGFQIDGEFDDSFEHFGEIHEQKDACGNDSSSSSMQLHISTILKGKPKQNNANNIAKDLLPICSIALR
jgi:hypothetical protein